ncbi:MAG: hypothetical protein QXH89_01435 [Candidatus Anstonellales archaeon]
MPELQIEKKVEFQSNKVLATEDITKRVNMFNDRIKDDESYMREDQYKIISEINEFRIGISNQLESTLSKIRRSDIIDMFQRFTVSIEQDVIEELNDRLNDMLRLATKLTEIAALGAIAAYLELKARSDELELSRDADEKIQNSKIKLAIRMKSEDRDILRKYLWFVRKKWNMFKDDYGTDNPEILKSILNSRGVLEEGERMFLELKIFKAIGKNDEYGAREYLKRYAEITNLRVINVMLAKGMKSSEIVGMFRGIFRILRVR